jgi:hypothetical protein
MTFFNQPLSISLVVKLFYSPALREDSMRPAKAMAMLVCHLFQMAPIAALVARSSSTGNGLGGYPDF